MGEDDLAQGFGPVPFPVYRLVPVPAANDEPDNKADDSRTAELDTLLQPLGIKREEYKTAGEAFLNGEGSRCRSNSDDSATAFISQVIKADMPPAERDVLVKARLQLLTTCDFTGQVVDAQLTPSANAQLFRTYLQAAADFYGGRFVYAERGFAAASTSEVPWLKETALYMTARTSLNRAQAEAFDEYGMPQREHVDKSALSDAEEGFLGYLKHYPQGDYVASARGLLRRVHWLANDDAKLAEDFTWQFTEATDGQRNVSVDELVEEADLKLLMVGNNSANSPMLQVVSDLMAMRAHTPPLLSREDLDKQRAHSPTNRPCSTTCKRRTPCTSSINLMLPSSICLRTCRRTSTTLPSASRPCAPWHWRPSRIEGRREPVAANATAGQATAATRSTGAGPGDEL